jgi:hypothetical protein
MDETHDRQLAAILARGLMRARQQAERTHLELDRGMDAPQPTAALPPGDVHQSADSAADNQGEHP